MLKLKYLFENYDLAKEALTHWEHDEATLDKMLSQFRISSNAIYPFHQDGKVCFLRLAPLSEKMEKNVLGEMEFIDYLLAHDYPALKPVPAKTGETCLTLDTRWGQYYAAAFHRVSGVSIEDTDLSGEVLYEYGKSLGRLHSLSSEFVPEVKKWTHAEVLDWISSVLTKYNAPDYALSHCAAIKSKLGALPVTRDNYGLVHYDFEPDNVFYDEEKKLCSVIDFDDGMYHWYALDIEQVFGSLEEDLELCGEDLLAAEKEFLRGYKEAHCYTREMEMARPLMRLFIDLYCYARLIRCVSEKFADEPEWLVELRNELNEDILEKETNMSHM